MARKKRPARTQPKKRKVESNGAEKNEKKRKVVKEDEGKKENEEVQGNKVTLCFMYMPSTRDQTHTVDIDDIIGDTIAKVKNTDEYNKNNILGFYISSKPKDGDVKFSYFGYDYLLHKKWSDYPEFVDSLDSWAVLISCASIYQPGTFLHEIKYPLIYYQHTDKDVSWPPGSNWDEGDPIMMTPFLSKEEHSKESHMDNKWDNLVVIEYPNGVKKVVNYIAYLKAIMASMANGRPGKEPLTNQLFASTDNPNIAEKFKQITEGKKWTDSTLPIVKLNFASNVGSSSSSSNVVDLVSEDEDDELLQMEEELLHPQTATQGTSSSTVTPHVHVWNVGDRVRPYGQTSRYRIDDTSTGTIISVATLNGVENLDITWDQTDRIGRAIRTLATYDEVYPIHFHVGDYVACKDSPLRGYVTDVRSHTGGGNYYHVRWTKYFVAANVVDGTTPRWVVTDQQDTKQGSDLVYWDGNVDDDHPEPEEETASIVVDNVDELDEESTTITPHTHKFEVGERVVARTQMGSIARGTVGTVSAVSHIVGRHHVTIKWDGQSTVSLVHYNAIVIDPLVYKVGDYVRTRGIKHGFVTGVNQDRFTVEWTHEKRPGSEPIRYTSPRNVTGIERCDLFCWNGCFGEEDIAPHTHKFETGERVVARTQMGSIAGGTVGTVRYVSVENKLTIKWHTQPRVSACHYNTTAVDPLDFKVGDYVRSTDSNTQYGFVIRNPTSNPRYNVEWTHEKILSNSWLMRAYQTRRKTTGIRRDSLVGWDGKVLR